MTIDSLHVYNLQEEVWERLVIEDSADIDQNGALLSKISGCLIDRSTDIPIEAKLHFFARNFFGNLIYLGSAETNSSGTFTFRFKGNESCFPDSVTIDVGVVVKKILYESQGLNTVYQEEPLGVFRTSIKGGKKELGDVYLRKKLEGMNQKIFRPITSNQNDGPGILTKLKLYPKRLYANVCKDNLDKDSICQLFLEKSDSVVVLNHPEKFLAFMSDVYGFEEFKIGKDGQFIWDIDLSKSIPNNQTVPTIRIVAKVGDDNNLKMKYIQIQYPDDEIAYQTLASSNDFHKAAYVANSILALKGELEISLGATEKLLGIIAEQFKRTVKKENPLHQLMHPIFDGATFTEWNGYDGVVEGEHKLLKMSALTKQERSHLIVKGLLHEASKLLDPPNSPLLKKSLGALKIEFYQSVRSFVLAYVERFEKITVPTNWEQIFYLSKQLNTGCKHIPLFISNPIQPYGSDLDNLVSFLTWCIIARTWGQWMSNLRKSHYVDPRKISFSFNTKAFGKGSEFDGYGDDTMDALIDKLTIASGYENECLSNGVPQNMVRGLGKIVDKYRSLWTTRTLRYSTETN